MTEKSPSEEAVDSAYSRAVDTASPERRKQSTDVEVLTRTQHQYALTDDLRADTSLKKFYAKRFIWILTGQLAVMNVVFFFVGFKWMAFSDVALNIYMAGTLAEVFGVALVITRYLFPKR